MLVLPVMDKSGNYHKKIRLVFQGIELMKILRVMGLLGRSNINYKHLQKMIILQEAIQTQKTVFSMITGR